MSQDLSFLTLSPEELEELQAEQAKLKDKWATRVHTPSPHEERYQRALHSNDAHSLFVQGRYGEALSIVDDDDLRRRIEQIAEVIYRAEHRYCDCDASTRYTLDTVFSLKHKTFVQVIACNVCGYLTLPH